MPGGRRPQESLSRARICKISNQPSNHTHNHLEASERGGEQPPPTPLTRPQALECGSRLFPGQKSVYLKFCKPCLYWRGGIKYELKQWAPGASALGPQSSLSGQPHSCAVASSFGGCVAMTLGGRGSEDPTMLPLSGFLVPPLASRTCCGRASNVTTMVALVTLRGRAPFWVCAVVLPRATLPPSHSPQEPRTADSRCSPATAPTPRPSVSALCTSLALTVEAVCAAEDSTRLRGRGGVPTVLAPLREDRHVPCAAQ